MMIEYDTGLVWRCDSCQLETEDFPRIGPGSVVEAVAELRQRGWLISRIAGQYVHTCSNENCRKARAENLRRRRRATRPTAAQRQGRPRWLKAILRLRYRQLRSLLRRAESLPRRAAARRDRGVGKANAGRGRSPRSIQTRPIGRRG